MIGEGKQGTGITEKINISTMKTPYADVNKSGSFSSSESQKTGADTKDIQRARDILPTYKERYIEKNPYAEAYERIRTGSLASLGRQAEINRAQLTAGLERTGLGANALRRVMARRNVDTELASRYLDAEKQLAEAGMMATDKARGALTDYINAYLNLASAQTQSYSAYMDAMRSGGGIFTLGGGRKKKRVSTGLVRHIGETYSQFQDRKAGVIQDMMAGKNVPNERGFIE